MGHLTEVKGLKFQRILIVDDSNTARMLGIITLKMLGYEDAEFIEAEDGLSALSIMETVLPDLIMTDILMPRINGRDFIRKIRSTPRYSGLPLIIATSLDQKSLVQDFPHLDNAFFLQKPLTPEKLEDALEALK